MPPGEPSAATNRPVSRFEHDHRRHRRTRAFAAGHRVRHRMACSSTARNEKSVSWLFRKNPPTARPDPNSDSTEVVIDTTLPSSSTITKWLVPGSFVRRVDAVVRQRRAGRRARLRCVSRPRVRRSVARGRQGNARRAGLRRARRRTPGRPRSDRDPHTSGGWPRRTAATPVDRPGPRVAMSVCSSSREHLEQRRRRSTAAAARTRGRRGKVGTAASRASADSPRGPRASACRHAAPACVRATICPRERLLEQRARPLRGDRAQRRGVLRIAHVVARLDDRAVGLA